MFENIYDFTSESYDLIKYILNSEIRLNILLRLLNQQMSVEDFQKQLNKKETNILRTLKELEELKLVEKKNKKYLLTSAGYLVARNISKFIENWVVSDKFQSYWNNHSIENYPYYFSKYLYLWIDAKLINSDYMNFTKTLDVFKEKIENQKDLKIILPIFSKYHLEAIIDSLVNNNGHLEIITSENIYEKIKQSEFSSTYKKLEDDENIKTYLTTNDVHKLFYTITDDCALLTLFYNDCEYDDSSIFVDENKDHVLMHKIMFKNYKEKNMKKDLGEI